MKKVFAVGAFLFSLSVVLFAADTSSNWVLAAEKFSFSQLGRHDEREEEFTSLLPQLILEGISTTASRMVPQDEMVDRKLSTLQTERNSLFLQLSKEVKTRDSYIISKLKERELKKSIKEQNKKINEVQEKIDANLESARKVKEEGLAEVKKRKILFFEVNSRRVKEYEEQAEKITLYKNDMSQLYKPTEVAIEEGRRERTYEKETTNAKINGVLSGKVTIYGEYVSATVELLRYPGCVSLGTITEVGLFSDPLELATNIAEFFGPKIVNSLPVRLNFYVQPEEAAAKATVTIDDEFYSKIPEDIVLDGGIHTVTFDAEGYNTRSITYNFAGIPECAVGVQLEETFEKSVTLNLKKFSDGKFIANGIDFGQNDAEKPTEITVNGRTVLGVLVSEIEGEQQTAFFNINEKKLADGASYTMNLKPFDRSKNIDKRRKMFYTSFTVLLCSLPFTFFCLGNNNQNVEAYNKDRRITFDKAKAWKTSTYITEGITGAAGAWTVFELVRYLKAANDVLPKEPKVAKESKTRRESRKKASQVKYELPEDEQPEITEETETIELEAIEVIGGDNLDSTETVEQGQPSDEATKE